MTESTTETNSSSVTARQTDMSKDYEEVSLSSGTIRYRDIGSGDPLLFVHGVLVNGHIWDEVISGLDQCRCIVPDLPFGAHEKPMSTDADLSPNGLRDIIIEFCDALSLDRVTLIGNDTGGAICQLAIAEYPDRIERLILTNCDAYENFLPLPLRPLQHLAHVPGVVWTIGAALRMRLLQRAMIFAVAKRQLDTDRMDLLFTPVVENPGVRRDLRKILVGVSARYTLQAAERFREFDKPVLIVWAPEDPLFRMKYARRLHSEFPNSTLVSVVNSRTFIQTDRPDALIEAISSFLDEATDVESQ